MNPIIDLEAEHLATLKDILAKTLPKQANIWLFGSRVTGRAKKFSDIDLLIDIGAPMSIEMLAKLNDTFEESSLPYKVDIADARSIDDSFQKNIQSQLILLSDVK